MGTEQQPAVQAGQIWTHSTHGFEVQTTRVSDEHVHYSVDEAEASKQKEAVDAFLEKEFGYGLVYVAKLGGGCKSHEEFVADFDYVRDRERRDYEE